MCSNYICIIKNKQKLIDQNISIDIFLWRGSTNSSFHSWSFYTTPQSLKITCSSGTAVLCLFLIYKLKHCLKTQKITTFPLIYKVFTAEAIIIISIFIIWCVCAFKKRILFVSQTLSSASHHAPFSSLVWTLSCLNVSASEIQLVSVPHC